MSFLLDTNICSAFLKSPGKLAHYFFQHSGQLHISTIVLAELYTWAERRTDPRPVIQAIDQDLLSDVRVLDFNRSCAVEFGRVRGQLLKAGNQVNPVDLMIAATVLTHNLTLVTHNTKHFQPIPGLRMVDWLAS